LIDAAQFAHAQLVARESMILAGRPWADAVYARIDGRVDIVWHAGDGDRLAAGATICELAGPARALLTGERTAINFLQTLSGTATVTADYVLAVAHTKARILDTRKTLPGLRAAQKYAVRCGGGCNHRQGLFDAILIKENHVRSAGGIAAALQAARQADPAIPIEIEVENLQQLREALAAGARRLMLDNFALPDMQQAVALNREIGRPPAELEASGGLTMDSLTAVAETGIDFISVGALTKHLRAIDLSMRFI